MNSENKQFQINLVSKIRDYIINKLSTKVDKEVGKGLSTNDYTNDEKSKLSGVVNSVPLIKTDINTLGEGITNLFPGSSNILRNTNTVVGLVSSANGTWALGGWRQGGGAEGTIVKVAIADAPNPDIAYGWKINQTNESTAGITATQNAVPLVIGQEYVFSCYVRKISGTPSLQLQYGVTGEYKYIRQEITSATWVKAELHFVPTLVGHIFIGTVNSAGSIEICGEKLEVGNKATDWSPSPWDTKTVIDQVNEDLTPLMGMPVRTTNTDLNDYKTTGVYFFSSSYTPINIPIGVNGWLMVLRASDTATKQVWFRQGTVGSNDHNTYIRTQSSGVWGAWMKVITQSDLDSLINYAVTNPTAIAAGVATGSALRLCENKFQYVVNGRFNLVAGTYEANTVLFNIGVQRAAVTLPGIAGNTAGGSDNVQLAVALNGDVYMYRPYAPSATVNVFINWTLPK